MFKHILAATDGSPLSVNAVRAAALLAKGMGARLTVVTCSLAFDAFALDPLMMMRRDEYEKAAGHAADARLHAARDVARACGVDCAIHHVFATHVHEGILAAAAKSKCDTIVMASHGRRGLVGVLLGSETTKVLTHATLPVMVVR